MATAPADAAADGEPQYDFISRWFGPLSGIPEDHVTGSAPATLAPVLGREARQEFNDRSTDLSARRHAAP